MYAKLAAAAVLFALPGLASAAGPMVISQIGKEFSERKLTVGLGQEIVFNNDDDITHNVYSRSKGYEFDLGAQSPGTQQSISFDQPGKVKIRCAIHPRMKLDIKVQ